MCDPFTIAGIAATVGSTVVNGMAASKAANARNDALAAERIRQGGLDKEAQALNAQSQDRYQGFDQKQAAKAETLGDYFAPKADAGEANAAAATAMPSASSDITVREIAKRSGQAKEFTDNQGQALATLRSFGDLLGDTSRLQARDASQIGQIGGFKRGSSNVLPLELEAASQKGNSLKMFGDILGGAGSLATGYGLTKGGGMPSLFGGAAPAASAAAPMAQVPLPVPRPASLFANTGLLR